MLNLAQLTKPKGTWAIRRTFHVPSNIYFLSTVQDVKMEYCKKFKVLEDFIDHRTGYANYLRYMNIYLEITKKKTTRYTVTHKQSLNQMSLLRSKPRWTEVIHSLCSINITGHITLNLTVIVIDIIPFTCMILLCCIQLAIFTSRRYFNYLLQPCKRAEGAICTISPST